MKSVLITKETLAEETRVALVPQDVTILTRLGYEIHVEKGLGLKAGFLDCEYEKAGAIVENDADKALAAADIVVRVNKPASAKGMKEGALHLSYLDPFNEKTLLNEFASAKLNAVSLEMIPRTTLAQKMDVQSSQTSLAGYYAVILAASKLPKIFPMMMTPAGTISPARVFIIGVGVAGLQAIATAKRLGARVEAFDTRPVVEEQVKSLGAKFVKIDLGEMGQTAQGYANALTPEQLEKQKQGQAKVCAQSDIVITTAKVFGRKAPLLLTKDMIAGMKPGSVIVDMAVSTGGNVEGSDPTKEVITENGVRIIGGDGLERCVPVDASKMLSGNVSAFLQHFWDAENKTLKIDLEEPIMKGCLLTHGGAIVHERFKNA